MSGQCCGTAQRLIFACSGAADVGAIADQAARKLAREGWNFFRRGLPA